jgi:hypothetical protein
MPVVKIYGLDRFMALEDPEAVALSDRIVSIARSTFSSILRGYRFSFLGIFLPIR